ncbi:hypothetical protein OSL60_28160, partial [Escherichia coli]|nr:hypothetical protein [Escherichia coli]
SKAAMSPFFTLSTSAASESSAGRDADAGIPAAFSFTSSIVFDFRENFERRFAALQAFYFGASPFFFRPSEILIVCGYDK